MGTEAHPIFIGKPIEIGPLIIQAMIRDRDTGGIYFKADADSMAAYAEIMQEKIGDKKAGKLAAQRLAEKIECACNTAFYCQDSITRIPAQNDFSILEALGGIDGQELISTTQNAMETVQKKMEQAPPSQDGHACSR